MNKRNILRSFYNSTSKKNPIYATSCLQLMVTLTMRFFNAQLCTPEELILLEKEYGGSFAHIFSQMMHIGQASRSDISYALARLSHFQSVQGKLGFELIKRVQRYLYHYANKPLIFLKNVSRRGVTTICTF